MKRLLFIPILLWSFIVTAQQVPQSLVGATTVVDLRLMIPQNPEVVNLLGVSSAIDGNGGNFFWDPLSTVPDNGFSIIAVAGIPTGRWTRMGTNFTNINNKPTTIAGYGITDAVSTPTLANYYLASNPTGYIISAPAIPVLSKSANYTILSADFGLAKVLIVNVDCTSGSVTLTEPTASTVSGYRVYIRKTDATVNTITISGLSTDNIIGVQNSAKETLSNGSTWNNN